MLRFIPTRDVLLWGLSTALLTLAALSYKLSGISVGEVVRALIVFPIAGAVWGTVMWWFQTHRR